MVFIPKGRKKTLHGRIWKFLGTVSHEMVGQKGCEIEKGHMSPDHVHMLVKIPLNYSVAEVIRHIKGK